MRDDPTKFPNAWFALGEIAEQDGKFTDAVDDFQNAIGSKPEFEPAYYDLALAQANLHQTESALGTLEQAHTRFNNPFRYEFYSGLVQREAKNYPEAINHFTEAETIAKANTAPERCWTNRFISGLARPMSATINSPTRINICKRPSTWIRHLPRP